MFCLFVWFWLVSFLVVVLLVGWVFVVVFSFFYSFTANQIIAGNK